MNFVIPMAGEGQRFKDAGYLLPKYLIESKGKTLLQWSIDSLPLALASKLIFIALKKHEEDFGITAIIKALYNDKVPNIEVMLIDGVTRGQAETVYLSKHLFLPNTPLLIFNIDTYFYSESLLINLQQTDCDGILGCFNSTEARFSFAAINHDGLVTKTTEKVPISNNALTGLYHFKLAEDFVEAAKYHFDNLIEYKNEYYVAPMYNYLINNGKRFKLDHVKEYHILGTPIELDKFNSLK